MITQAQILSFMQNNILGNLVYDVFKFIIALIIVNLIYEKLYIKYKWGKWKVIIKNGNKTLLERKLSPYVAKKIFDDEGDFSIYIKGIVSPYGWLSIDIASQEAKNIKLLNIDNDNRTITIDLSKNPPKK